MPFALLIIGLTLLVSGVRGTEGQLYSQIKSDFQGSGSFVYWMFSILIIGAVGYIPDFRSLSRAFMLLVIVVLILKEGTGFWSQLESALKSSTNSSGVTGGW